MRKPNNQFLKETELFEPVKELFIEEGYQVHAEVRGCDLCAHKDDELIIIELKLRFSTQLLLQAVNRLALSSYVFVAIPRTSRQQPQSYLPLMRRLNIGLIEVTSYNQHTLARFLYTPVGIQKKKAQSRQQKLLATELAGRSKNINIGGSHKTKLMTAYREQSISIACFLAKHGEASPAIIKEQGFNTSKAASILLKNYYGWFIKIKRGLYDIAPHTLEELEEFPRIKNYYRGLYDKAEVL